MFEHLICARAKAMFDYFDSPFDAPALASFSSLQQGPSSARKNFPSPAEIMACAQPYRPHENHFAIPRLKHS
jgi:hypothetical protein